MNWGELKALARAYVHRSDLDFDALQNLACSNISISLIVQENEVTGNVTLSGPDGNGIYSASLPSDYALMRSVVQSGITLNPVDITTLVGRVGSRYAVSGLKIHTASGNDCSLVYTARVEPFVSDDEADILLTRYPDVFLYALLKHAAAVMQDPEINQEFYEQQFRGAVTTANALYWDAAIGPGAMMRPMGGII